MGLIYDDPQLAALTLTRMAAEESEGPSELTCRMHAALDDLAQRNGTAYLAELVITLARARFIDLDDLARAIGTDTGQLLDGAELRALEDLSEGW
jgi:hypothetical protein